MFSFLQSRPRSRVWQFFHSINRLWHWQECQLVLPGSGIGLKPWNSVARYWAVGCHRGGFGKWGFALLPPGQALPHCDYMTHCT
jgi:hypothetical protein